MSEWQSLEEFEKNIQESFGAPSIRPEFQQQLYQILMSKAVRKSQKPYRFSAWRPVWAVMAVLLITLSLAILIAGPQRVYAAMRQMLGYIPGIGIIQQDNSIRILAEPVSVTRKGITVTISQAIATDTETRIIFGDSGVPLSAYPKNETVSGCMTPPFLKLPDGSQMDISAPLPPGVNEVTFVLPCIFNTLPGAVPEEWEIPLRFVPAPPDFKILPVVEITEQLQFTPTITSQQFEESLTSSENPVVSVSVEKMIETEDGYILLGYINPKHLPEGSWLNITGLPVIQDADGKKVSYTYPVDVQPLEDHSLTQGGIAWALQFKSVGVKFPIDIQFTGNVLTPTQGKSEARIVVDVGNTPHLGQVWELNREIELAGKTIRLVSMTAGANGYTFQLDLGDAFASIDLSIEGYTPIGSGGGGPYVSLEFPELPKGSLTIIFSNPIESSPPKTWETSWQPENLREFINTSQSTVCFNANTLQTVPALPQGLNGKIILTQLNPQQQIVMVNLNGEGPKTLEINAARAALNKEGTFVAYTTEAGIIVQNLVNGKKSLIPGSYGHDLHWSPDSRFLAVVNAVGQNGIFLINIETQERKQLTALGYEDIAGWSPDGRILYYAIPDSSPKGFLLRAIQIENSESWDVFVLENSSQKAPFATISWDGNWIAYRASDNSGLYIKGLNGNPSRLILENPALAISGLVWDEESHILAVSLITQEVPEGEVFLISPENCESYRLPNLHGEVNGVIIP